MNEVTHIYHLYFTPLTNAIGYIVAGVGISAVIGVGAWLIKMWYMYQDEKASRAEQVRLVRELMISNAENALSIKHIEKRQEKIEKGQDKLEQGIEKVLTLLEKLDKYVHEDMHDKVERLATQVMTLTTDLEKAQKEVTLLKARSKKTA